MLRRVLLAIGGVLIAIAVMVTARGGTGAIPTGVVGLVVVLSIVFERHVYKPLADKRPGLGWQPNGERFIDPETGRLVTVYSKSATGERMYVQEGGPAPPR